MSHSAYASGIQLVDSHTIYVNLHGQGFYGRGIHTRRPVSIDN